MTTRRNRKYVPQNRNATIRSRQTRNGKLRTETFRRDEDTVSMAVSTHNVNNSTDLFIDIPGTSSVRLNGRQARTLFRLLRTHYDYTGKSQY